jgi:hypothetical protein
MEQEWRRKTFFLSNLIARGSKFQLGSFPLPRSPVRFAEKHRLMLVPQVFFVEAARGGLSVEVSGEPGFVVVGNLSFILLICYVSEGSTRRLLTGAPAESFQRLLAKLLMQHLNVTNRHLQDVGFLQFCRTRSLGKRNRVSQQNILQRLQRRIYARSPQFLNLWLSNLSTLQLVASNSHGHGENLYRYRRRRAEDGERRNFFWLVVLLPPRRHSPSHFSLSFSTR